MTVDDPRRPDREDHPEDRPEDGPGERADGPAPDDGPAEEAGEGEGGAPASADGEAAGPEGEESGGDEGEAPGSADGEAAEAEGEESAGDEGEAPVSADGSAAEAEEEESGGEGWGDRPFDPDGNGADGNGADDASDASGASGASGNGAGSITGALRDALSRRKKPAEEKDEGAEAGPEAENGGELSAEEPEAGSGEAGGGVSIADALKSALTRKPQAADAASGENGAEAAPPAGAEGPDDAPAESGGTGGGGTGDGEAKGEEPAERLGWFRRRLDLRRSLRVQIAASLATPMGFTLMASIVALAAFFRVGNLQQEINTSHVPALTTAVRIEQLATRLAGTAPRIVAAAQNRAFATDPAGEEGEEGEDGAEGEEGEGESGGESGGESMGSLMEDAAQLIEVSAGLGDSERTAPLQAFSADLASNLRDVQISVDASTGLQEMLDTVQEQAVERVRELNEIIGPPIDDQYFFMATGLRELDDEPASILIRGSEAEISRYRALSVIQSGSNLAASLISEVAVQDDSDLVRTLEERFDSGISGARREMARLGNEVPRGLARAIDRLEELGEGEDGAFAMRQRYLVELSNQQAYLTRNRSITDSLDAAVTGLTVGLEVEATEATEASEAALTLGRSLLLALNVLALTCTALILWLFVGRFLIVRLTNLSAAMRRMAGGDLKTKVQVRGQDEVGEMAQALEVFRQHALEVQRLNLVEQLAARVEAQNEELAATLDDLQKAQDQMVMQEKLASLGQLTAGIAHEIKNPLNFVNNFADISNSLVNDLKEELETVAGLLPEDTKEEVEDISKDLTENLERIVHHGKRASNIVYGMLEHARKEGGASRPTEINSMLEEYIALAFHSMRAVDNTFQMTIEKDFGEDVGSVVGVPQDLSRVFLNIVTNACQATLEKQTAETTAADYKPTLSVTSRRENGQVEVRIRDNGPGIPEEHLKKIFEPFFTTKDTDKGTGLGLSLCHDIVRGHGGTLAVNSEIGKGAEFVITLPSESAAAGDGAAADAAGAEAEA